MNLLAEHALSFPDRLALSAGGRQWTWKQLHDEAGPIAAILQHEYGMEPGDVIATAMENSAEHVILLHAIFLCGAAAAPLNTRLTTAERDRQLAFLAPGLLIAQEPPSNSNIAQKAPEDSNIAQVPASQRTVSASQLMAAVRSDSEPEFLSVDPDDNRLCSILFTSGSSGAMKAVPHTWHNHRSSAMGSAANLGVRGDDNWLCIIPLYHIGGLTIVTRSLLYGTAMTVQQGFDTAAVLEALHNRSVTLLSVVPTMLQRLLQSEKFSAETLPLLRAILLGGAAASRGLWESACERELPVLGTYGLTETCSQVVTASPEAVQLMSGSAGRAIDGAEIRIQSEDGTDVANGAVGEICIRGEMLARGYFRNPELSAERFVDGWLHTGDVGLLDANGCLHVLGRLDDMIVTGGENVYPTEIEDVLLRHPSVADAAVIGVEDAEWGMQIAALVVLREEVNFSQLESWCRAELAGYKIPRKWRKGETLPLTASGKLLRGEVRRMMKLGIRN